MNKSKQHAYTTEHKELNPAAETSYAERTRTLLYQNHVGVLSTHSDKCQGFPFGSTMPFALDDKGRPLFLVSSMAMHTQNLKADGRASLFVAAADAQVDPLGASRLTLVGNAAAVTSNELESVRALYLERHPNASYYVDFADFSFWRLEPVELYFVGGFGVMGWVDIDEFRQAAPDPLATAAEEIAAHMNQDHVQAMLAIAAHEKGVIATDAKMTAVDRLGFHLRLQTAERVQSVRVGFPSEVRDQSQCHAAMVALAKQAQAPE